MIKGIHHIGITVPNLDQTVAFYQEAIDLRCVHEELVDPVNRSGTRTVLLGGHTAYLELSQLADPQPIGDALMPVFGPGITHLCFQSPAIDSAFEKLRQQGASMHSRGDVPVKLARPDITYVYLRDCAGNIIEAEQWDDPPKPFPVWIAHVALASPNIERLTNFYSSVLLGLDAPPEIRRINGIPTLDVVGNLDNIDLYGTWIPTPNIQLEIWQYVNPPTPPTSVCTSLETLGYTHICFEVDDIDEEALRLTALGVSLQPELCQTETYKALLGRDPDGNLFELRQFLDPAAPLSLDQLDLG